MTNVVTLTPKKGRTWTRHTIKIKYTNGDEELVLCNFFGVSIDIPGFIVILDGDPELEESALPKMLLNIADVRNLKIVHSEEIPAEVYEEEDDEEEV